MKIELRHEGVISLLFRQKKNIFVEHGIVRLLYYYYIKATSKNFTFRINKRVFFETFAWLTSSMLLSLEIANAGALLFTRLIATFVFFVVIFLFLFQSYSPLYSIKRK